MQDVVDDLPHIHEIQRMALHPEDIIVLRFEQKLRASDVEDIRERLTRLLGVPNKILILDKGARLDIVAPEDANASA
jgi:hypothetical protein